MKKQNDFTFGEAKKAAAYRLSELATFMEGLNSMLPDKVSLDWAILLRVLELKVSQALSPCLHKNDLKQVMELAGQLIQANPDVCKQLTQFWNLYAEVFSILKSNPTRKKYAPQGIISDNWSRIKNADSLTENLVVEVRNHPSTFAFPIAFLLAHVVRAETVGFAIWKQLDDIVKEFEPYGLSKYDIELICSVQNTVVKYDKRTKQNEVRSDVKAIRDSIAHGHFLIRKSAVGYEIDFNNSEYPFHKLFSKRDFEKFFDLNTILYKLQLALLLIIELLPILTTHFLEKTTAG